MNREIHVRFRERLEGKFLWPTRPFLIISADDDNVYLLYFHIISQYPLEELHAGFWILNIRILNDNELMTLYRED